MTEHVGLKTEISIKELTFIAQEVAINRCQFSWRVPHVGLATCSPLQRFFVFMLNLAPRSWRRGRRNPVPRPSQLRRRCGRLGSRWESCKWTFLSSKGCSPRNVCWTSGVAVCVPGAYFLDYLEPGNYLGLDKEQELVTLGLTRELKPGLLKRRSPSSLSRPHLSLSGSRKSRRCPLPEVDLHAFRSSGHRRYLKKLRAFVDVGHVLYATFFEGEAGSNHKESHDIWAFCYPRTQMEQFGQETGWKPHYIGDWNQPRNQMMMRYEADPGRRASESGAG